MQAVWPIGSSALPPLGAPPELAAIPIGIDELRNRSDGRSFVVRRLSARPLIFHLKSFLTQDECDALISAAKRKGLHKADTTMRKPYRISCDVSTVGASEEPAAAAAESDIVRTLLSKEATSLPGGGSEDLHVLRYQPGGMYKPHYDAEANPRYLTVLYYLNNKGATWFPFADSAAFGDRMPTKVDVAPLKPDVDGLTMTPASAGDALAFYNFDAEGAMERLALHAGMPAKDTKWIGSHFFWVPALCAPFAEEAETTRPTRPFREYLVQGMGAPHQRDSRHWLNVCSVSLMAGLLLAVSLWRSGKRPDGRAPEAPKRSKGQHAKGPSHNKSN